MYNKEKVSLNGQILIYYLEYREQKNIVLKIREGKIFITAPKYSFKWEIEQLIYRNISKIQIFQNNYEQQSKYDLFSSKPWIKIFDEFIYISLTSENIHTKMIQKTIYMHDYLNNDEQLKRIYLFLIREYKNWFINRSNKWSQKMNLDFKNLSLKVMKTKWGACYPTTKKLLFNPKLLHFSPEIIDYVIVHELSHLEHPNHSRQFWNNIKKYLPNYSDIKSILDASGI